MTITDADRAALEALERRLRIMLPEQYQDSYEDVQPVSMGSAGLKYGPDGTVLWNEMWESFCDLAMAGGPPHKGALLAPGDAVGIEAARPQYEKVVAEICRGVGLVTGLTAAPAPDPGWVRVECTDDAMAQWLQRAIVMENVAARRDGLTLDLPASPAFRIEKEIKNVITVVAKTCHYWMDHIWDAHQALIGEVLRAMDSESPLIEPAIWRSRDANGRESDTAARMAEDTRARLGLAGSSPRRNGWFGIDYLNVQSAVWMMRAMVASNVLSRREGTLLYVPINPDTDAGGAKVMDAVTRTHHLGVVKAALNSQAPASS
jgi:hypothetical protein